MKDTPVSWHEKLAQLKEEFLNTCPLSEGDNRHFENFVRARVSDEDIQAHQQTLISASITKAWRKSPRVGVLDESGRTHCLPGFKDAIPDELKIYIDTDKTEAKMVTVKTYRAQVGHGLIDCDHKDEKWKQAKAKVDKQRDAFQSILDRNGNDGGALMADYLEPDEPDDE